MRERNSGTKAKGITLIALIVTIIILLILAGVTLSLIGKDGIIAKAQAASFEHKKGQYKESLEMILAEERTDRAIEAKEECFAASLSKTISDLEWVKNVYYLNQAGENIEKAEEAGYLLVETTDGYDLMVEVDNSILYGKVLDYFEKSGETCTVTYMANNETNENTTTTVKKNFYITAKNEDVFKKSGYKIVGWYTNQTVPEGASLIGIGSKFQVTEDITLYAIWEKNPVKITFNSNNGNNQTDTQSINEGVATSIKDVNFEYEGYSLKEWNTNPDGTGTKYSKNQTVTLNQNIELYAMWDEIITASVVISNDKITEGTTITLGGTAQVSGIEKVELKYGQTVLYSDNGSGNKTYNKTNIGVNNLSNLGSLPFYNTTLKAVVTSRTGKTKEKTVNVTNYTVSTAAQLKKFADVVNSGKTLSGETIIQLADIDLSSVCSSSKGSWTPIGDVNNNTSLVFSGTFDGKKHLINNLYINSSTSSKQALFGKIDSNGTVKNVTIGGNIYGYQYVAGICAIFLNGRIENCINNCLIKGSIGIGGIVARNGSGNIIQCANHATITGEATGMNFEDQGGIVGSNLNGTVKMCYNTGELVNNTSTSWVTYDVGGIVGQNGQDNKTNDSLIKACYNTGKITTTNGDRIGGITGWNANSATVLNCYNIGNVTGKSNYGSIVGSNNTIGAGTITNTYFLTGTASNGIGSGSGSATAKTAAQLKALTSTIGTAFVADTKNINQGYPILNWQ